MNILDIENNGILIETIQVKSYVNLVLSDLSPAKNDSFFHRSIKLLLSPTPPKIKLVNFGAIGDEMRLAWLGDVTHRASLAKKLFDYGFDAKNINVLFDSIELIAIDETNEKDQLFEQLREQVLGIDPETSFDLLNFWLYVQSEKRAQIGRADLINKVQKVGRFLNERYHYHKEWFTAIQPIEDHIIEAARLPQLREEFYAGVSARYEHVLAGVDFRRESKAIEITRAFEKANVVILLAASGQGKTTLAYRYLHDMYPSQWRFSVQAVENRQHALSITAALAGHANAVQSPMAIFIDVSPHDAGWPELVKQLSRNKYLQILVSIREEDFRRTNISSAFAYVSIDLSFTKDEANLIYGRIREAGYPLSQLTFEDAWHSFGGNGPLMEFVYLLTQTRTLRHRLEEQVNRIRFEVREKNLSPDELVLLRLAAVATACDARVRLSDLISLLNLPEPGLTLKLFEKEYLLKTTPDNQYIIGLHPIRSRILAELLTDPSVSPWIAAAKRIIGLIPEEDWELFFMQALQHRNSDFKDIIDLILELFPSTWVGLSGMVRCLLWVGVKEYIEENWSVSEAARDLFGKGWYFILDYNFAGEEALTTKGWWRKFGDLIPEGRQKQIEENCKNQTPKERIFKYANTWLARQRDTFPNPLSDRDWKSIAEVLYWAFRWGISQKFEPGLSDDTLFYAVRSVSLGDLSEFSFGLHLANPDRHVGWINANKTGIEERLARELMIISITEAEDTLTIHFLTYPADDTQKYAEDEKRKKSLHDETIERINLIRQLFPQYEKFGAQGYGHQIPNLGLEHNQTTKTGIPKESLPPSWPIRLNGMAIGLVEYKHRLDTWKEYLDEVLRARKLLVECLLGISTRIVKYFQSEKHYNILKSYVFESGKWDECDKLISNMPILPKPAVDGWGISGPDGGVKEVSSDLQRFIPQSILNQTFKPYLEAERELFSSLRNFMKQAPDVMFANYLAGKLPDGSPQKRDVLQPLLDNKSLKDNRRLSLINCEQAKDNQRHYQRCFRDLFSSSVDIGALVELETSESAVINMLWESWYFFALFPRTAIGNPKKRIPAMVDKMIQELIHKYDDCIARFGGENTRITRLDTNLRWEDSPAIWIHLDIDCPIHFNKVIEELILALRESIGVIKAGDIRYRLIEENAQYTVILPTIREKMINTFVWPLRTTFTISNEESFEIRPWAYLPKELPPSIKDALGISMWDDETILKANQLSSNVATTGLLLSLIGQVGKIPEPSEAGTKCLQEFSTVRSKELSKLVQTFIDLSAEFIDVFSGLSRGERENRPYLSRSITILSEVYKQVFPSDNFDKQEILDLNAILQYAERVQKIIMPVEEMKLCLIADALDHQQVLEK